MFERKRGNSAAMSALRMINYIVLALSSPLAVRWSTGFTFRLYLNPHESHELWFYYRQNKGADSSGQNEVPPEDGWGQTSWGHLLE